MHSNRPPHISDFLCDEWQLFCLLLRHPNISRIGITELSPYGKSKTDALLRDLSAKGFMTVTEAENSGKGRRPFNYAVVPELAYFLGAELHPIHDRIALMNFAGEIIASTEFPPSYDTEDVILSLRQNLLEVSDSAGVPRERLVGVGVGLHGLTDITAGLIHRILYRGKQIELNVKEGLSKALSLPVYVAQPRTLVLYRELGFSLVDSKGITATMNLGYGVGVGLFINGKSYEGATGMAGQIGHVVVPGNNRPCYCGNIGCLRTLISYKGICERASEMLQDERGFSSVINRDLLRGPRYEDGVNHIVDCALGQDKLGAAILHEISELLGSALSQIINLFNPHHIIIHTNFVRAGDQFTGPVRLHAQRNSLSSSLSELKLEFAPLERFAAAEGGAVCALLEYTGSQLRE